MPRQVRSRFIAGKKSTSPPRLGVGVVEDQPCSHYQILDVAATASTADIRAAYKRRALTTHPDKGGVALDFQKVLDAFQTLSDAARRCVYDQQQPEKQTQRPWRRAHCSLLIFNRKLAELLRRMSAACRRDTILRRLDSTQRTGLEKHMHEEKAKSTGSELCQSEGRNLTGIYRASRTGGYYAKVFLYSLGLQAHARKELADAVNDHIALMKVVEFLRYAYFESNITDRSEPVKMEADLPPGLVASFQVYFYNRHFIGNHHLQLNFKTLTEGLDAWEEMQKAKGTPLFRGNGVTEAYSPEAAMKQWHRVKDAYLQFASGRRHSRAELEEQLLQWEKQNMPARMQRDCTIWRRQQSRIGKLPAILENEVTDAVLLRHVERLLKKQARVACSQQPQEKTLCGRKRTHHELLS